MDAVISTCCKGGHQYICAVYFAIGDALGVSHVYFLAGTFFREHISTVVNSGIVYLSCAVACYFAHREARKSTVIESILEVYIRACLCSLQLNVGCKWNVIEVKKNVYMYTLELYE